MSFFNLGKRQKSTGIHGWMRDLALNEPEPGGEERGRPQFVFEVNTAIGRETKQRRRRRE
jgi:hypothetical protein